MTRNLIVSLGAALALTLVGPVAVAAQAPHAQIPARTSLGDPKNDVSKHFSPRAVRGADLDLRRTTTAARKGDRVVLRVKVTDLKPKYLKDKVDGGTHSVPALISVFVYFGTDLRWQVSYGPFDEPFVDVSHPHTPARAQVESRSPGDCTDEQGATRYTQKANYATNVVTLVLPVACLPAGFDRASVNAKIGWTSKQNAALWDDSYQQGDDRRDPRKSTPFRFR